MQYASGIELQLTDTDLIRMCFECQFPESFFNGLFVRVIGLEFDVEDLAEFVKLVVF